MQGNEKVEEEWGGRKGENMRKQEIKKDKKEGLKMQGGGKESQMQKLKIKKEGR